MFREIAWHFLHGEFAVTIVAPEDLLVCVEGHRDGQRDRAFAHEAPSTVRSIDRHSVKAQAPASVPQRVYISCRSRERLPPVLGGADRGWKLCQCGWRPDLGPHYSGLAEKAE